MLGVFRLAVAVPVAFCCAAPFMSVRRPGAATVSSEREEEPRRWGAVVAVQGREACAVRRWGHQERVDREANNSSVHIPLLLLQLVPNVGTGN